MKFSVCIDALFKGADRERIENCKKAGAEAFEIWAWWERDLDTLRKAAGEAGLKTAAICTKFVSLTEPGKRAEYKEGLRQSLQAAAELGCGILIAQTGNDTGEERALQHKSIVEGLKECVPLLEKAGVTLALEPLNITIDHKGYYLRYSAEAFEIAAELASPHVKILYDIYHQQVTEGNITNTIRDNIESICHFHCAGLPGRAELQRGEINYPFVFSEIGKTGFQGYIGLEYFPKEEPLENLRKILQGPLTA